MKTATIIGLIPLSAIAFLLAPKKPVAKKVDRGFIYDCKSFKVTNAVLMNEYFTKVTDSLAKKYPDPYKLDVANYVSDFLKKINSKCQVKYEKGTFNLTEGLLITYLIELAINKYMFKFFGVLSLRQYDDMTWVNNQTTEDEIEQQKKYWEYKKTFIGSQIEIITGYLETKLGEDKMDEYQVLKQKILEVGEYP